MKNVRPLSVEELDFILTHYKITECGDYIIVGTSRGGQRKTLHDKTSGFFITSAVRKIKLDGSIPLWLNSKKLKKYELVEVQNALNHAEVLYIDKTEDNLVKIIEEYRIKLKENKNEQI